MTLKATLIGLVLLLTSLTATAKEPPRVRQARKSKLGTVQRLLARVGLSYPPRQVLLRVFKKERRLEVWARGDAAFKRVQDYAICAASGELGPKRRQGDYQVPEGFYHIAVFNPWSAYHLSMGINYPNASDRLLGYRPNLGSAIMIHGNCVSIGCMAITDDKIKEVYLLALGARQRGQRRVPVHIFPTRLTDETLRRLQKNHSARLVRFWRNLQPGYLHFEKHRQLPRINVDRRGRYVVRTQSGVVVAQSR